MSKRENYIGTRVSKKEKEEIIKLAKGMDITVSDLIRHRVIRPMITLPEVIQNLKLYFDSKFYNFEERMTKTIKEQLLIHKPVKRRTMIIEEYNDIPIERINHIPPKVLDMIDVPPEIANSMKNVMKEMAEGFELEILSDEILKQPRPIPDPIAYKEWKIKTKGKKRLRESSVFAS